MKHRSTGGLLLVAALTLAACAPPDAGADEATSTPATEETPASDAPTTAPEPADDGQDEY